LKGLEKLLASAFVPQSSTEDLDYFLALQYTFECNGACAASPEMLGLMVGSTVENIGLDSGVYVQA
jgi:NADH:ubiquinone oxidoreductase subunit E